MENKFYLLTTYLIVKQGLEAQVQCNGSKELIEIDIEGAKQIVGLIKHNGHLVPVVDLSIQINNFTTKITDSSCLLIISCDSVNSKKSLIAVLLDSFDDILAISSGDIVMSKHIKISKNLKILTELTSSLDTAAIWENTVKAFRTYLDKSSWEYSLYLPSNLDLVGSNS